MLNLISIFAMDGIMSFKEGIMMIVACVVMVFIIKGLDKIFGKD